MRCQHLSDRQFSLNPALFRIFWLSIEMDITMPIDHVGEGVAARDEVDWFQIGVVAIASRPEFPWCRACW